MASIKAVFSKKIGIVTMIAFAAVLALSATLILFSALGGALRSDKVEPLTVFSFGDIVDTLDADYTYEEMEADLGFLAEKYPNIMKLASGGLSLDGRNIYYVDFGDLDGERQIMLNSGIHGREYMTPQFTMKLLEYTLTNYYVENGDGKTYSELFEGMYIRLVPMINPDGIAISQRGLDGISDESLKQKVLACYEYDMKNETYHIYKTLGDYLRMWKANAAGIDLNRNFDIDYWEKLDTSIKEPSSQKFKGHSPASEPETVILKRLTEELDGLVLSVSIHSQGEIIYWNCGQYGQLKLDTLELAELLAEQSGYELQGSFTAPDASYNDWCALNLGIPSVLIETGSGSCPLPIEQFETIWQKNSQLIEKLVAEYNK